jgi:hypothetical protein
VIGASQRNVGLSNAGFASRDSFSQAGSRGGIAVRTTCGRFGIVSGIGGGLSHFGGRSGGAVLGTKALEEGSGTASEAREGLLRKGRS